MSDLDYFIRKFLLGLKPRKRYVKEADITTYVINEIYSKLNGWIYKIEDVGISKKPFDIIACINGRFVAIEIKIDKRKKGCNEYAGKEVLLNEVGGGMLYPHQIMNLKSIQKRKGIAIVLVYLTQCNLFYIIKI